MDDCVEWEGARTPQGYGVVRYDSKNCYVHRIAYCEANGIPLSAIDGKVVRHVCDNPPCRNPNHLQLGTHKDNSADTVARRRAKGNRYAGPRAKLSDAEVAAIRAEYRPNTRGRGCTALAKKYGVSFQQIWRVVTNRSRR